MQSCLDLIVLMDQSDEIRKAQAEALHRQTQKLRALCSSISFSELDQLIASSRDSRAYQELLTERRSREHAPF